MYWYFLAAFVAATWAFIFVTMIAKVPASKMLSHLGYLYTVSLATIVAHCFLSPIWVLIYYVVH